MELPRKKILVIGPGMEIGGVERSLIGLLDSLDYDRVEVDLYLFAHSGELMPFINPKVNLLPEEPVFALGTQKISSLFLTGHFLIGGIRLIAKVVSDLKSRFIKRGSVSNNTTLCKKWLTSFAKPLLTQYDLALGFFGPHYFLSQKVKAKTKIGWVHTDYGNAHERPDVDFMLPMWSAVDWIACVSDSVKKSFDALYPSLTGQSIVIENILPQEFVRQQAQLDQESVQNEMPEDGRARILTVGRFSTPKNYLGIVDACKILHDEGMQFVWYLIGYGPLESEIRKKISEYHAEEYVKILGKKVNPYPYIAACDIYAQPSLYEGKAVTVREAQMLGKSVLITNFATASSQLEDGVDGYVVSLDINGIANGIKYLIQHPEFLQVLSKNTLKRDYSGRNTVDLIYQYL